MGSVAGKVAIVTGAGAGIGRATAGVLAKHGAKVVVTCRTESTGEETAAKIRSDGGEALFLRQDVAVEDDWTRVIEQTRAAFGGIDLLVNNAGVYVISALADTTLEQWNHVFAVNVTSAFLGAKCVAPCLIERGGGSIINVSSMGGILGIPGHSCYGASKGAVRTFTKHLAAELGPQNVRVNSVHPTFVRTAMADYGAKVSGKSLEEMGTDLTVLGRIGEPADVANVILFLAADTSSYLTGGEYLVDGGGASTL